MSALVDPSDLRWRWVGTGSKRHAAANATIGGKQWMIYVHRLIMECPPHLQVDHIDRDTANNMRSNLRLATHGQNLANQGKPRWRLCEFRGVRSPLNIRGCSRPYVAAIKKDGKEFRSQAFATQEEAAREYDRMALLHYGEFAVLNFPAEAGVTVHHFNQPVAEQVCNCS